MISAPIYKLRPSEVYTSLETSPAGIPPGEVVARQKLYGENQLAPEPPPNLGEQFLQSFAHPLALILWAGGGIAFLASDPVLGLVIWLLVLVNAGLSRWRERRAEQAMRALRNFLPDFARIVRAGLGEMNVPADQIVPGDVLVLAEGDHIPADARLVEAYGLRINNASLTGEAMPARKSADASLQEGLSEIERPNLVFAGTSVVSGTGKAIVYATGMLTQFGRVARLTQAVREQPSPLQIELLRLTRRISFVALGISMVVFVVGAFEVGLSRFEAFLLALGVLVAAIPEGLPANITLSLAVAGQRLAGRGVLVKKLAAIETLGTVSTICTDKSGTLTQNQMTVRKVWLGGQTLEVSGVGYEPQGSYSPDPGRRAVEADLRLLLSAGVLCNNARFEAPTAARPYGSGLGDQTEVALHVAALKLGVDPAELNRLLPRLHELPFEANRKRMSTLHHLPQSTGEGRKAAPAWLALLAGSDAAQGEAGERQAVFVKGAPRELLQLCTHILWQGQVRRLEEAQRGEILRVIDEFSSQALRLLGLACRGMPVRGGGGTGSPGGAGPTWGSALPEEAARSGGEGGMKPISPYMPEQVEQGLTFLGLAAMQDPPRPEVAQAIQTLRGAGIRLIMVTGDYGLTAESLARRVGMLDSPNPQIVNGAELEDMQADELDTLLDEEVIFARMAPEHKLRLVAALQRRGQVVAVTGDGVNDAPALRKADVGVCMGINGTDVAKEAADVILTNDNFAAIVAAIEEGRAVFDNVRKFATYIFASNVPEILPFLLTSLLNLPLALTVRQILAIDLGTDLLPGLALGTEKPEPEVMQRPPRRPGQPLIDGGLLGRALLWLGLVEALLCYTGFLWVQALAGRLGPLPWPAFLLPLLPDLSGWAPAQVDMLAATTFHAGVVAAQVGNAFACRTETQRGRALGWLSNRVLLYSIAIEAGLILMLIYFPPLANAFDHLPLPASFWLWLVAYAPVLYSLDWMRKGIVRRSRRLRNRKFRSNGSRQAGAIKRSVL